MSVALVNNWKASVTLLLVITIKGPVRGAWGVFSPPHRNLGIQKRKWKGKAQPFPKQQIRAYNKQVCIDSLFLSSCPQKQSDCWKPIRESSDLLFSKFVSKMSKKKCLSLLFIEQSDFKKALKSARNWKGRGSIICSVHLSHIGI